MNLMSVLVTGWILVVQRRVFKHAIGGRMAFAVRSSYHPPRSWLNDGVVHVTGGDLIAAG